MKATTGETIAFARQVFAGPLEDRIKALEARNAELEKDAARYRWIRSAKKLHLESAYSCWTDEHGEPFTQTHRLSAFDTSYGAYSSLDALIDAALSQQEATQ